MRTSFGQSSHAGAMCHQNSSSTSEQEPIVVRGLIGSITVPHFTNDQNDRLFKILLPLHFQYPSTTYGSADLYSSLPPQV